MSYINFYVLLFNNLPLFYKNLSGWCCGILWCRTVVGGGQPSSKQQPCMRPHALISISMYHDDDCLLR
ncbi:hypothetical protein HanIR_Chr08g0383861 [Helianthus annuus]|nr:hypothetical protein HanIR_Chr08g0383861 [Helianthus annuus]